MNKKFLSWLHCLGLISLQQAAHANPALPAPQQLIDSIQSEAHLHPLDLSLEMDTLLNQAYQVNSPGLSLRLDYCNEMHSITLTNMINPIAVIGSDSHSLTWLMNQKSTLKKQRAIIWLIKSQGTVDVEKVKMIAPSFLILPMSGEILTQYGIRYYPLLLRIK